MKKIIIFIAFLFLFVSCKDYVYEYSIQITYHDNTTEIINVERESVNGKNVNLYFEPKGNCLYVYSGNVFNGQLIACDIRKYKVIKLKTTLVK